MTKQFVVWFHPEDLPAENTEATAVAAWEVAVIESRKVRELGTQVVVVVIDGHLEVMGAVHCGPDWPGREVATYG